MDYGVAHFRKKPHFSIEEIGISSVNENFK